MQEFSESEKLLRTLTGTMETLQNEPPHPKAERRIIAELPKVGSYVEINGIVFVVKFSDRRGHIHLVLQEPAGACPACKGYGYRLHELEYPKCETCDGTGFPHE